MIETRTITIPPRLMQEAEVYVQAGWTADFNALVVEALRRYLESHRDELQERFLQHDIEWGLHGNE